MFRVNAKTLRAALAKVTPALEYGSGTPILTRVRFGAILDNTVRLSATNLDVQVDVDMTAEPLGEPKAVCISPRRVLPLLRLIPGMDTLEFTVDSSMVDMAWPGGRVRFDWLPAADFPDLEPRGLDLAAPLDSDAQDALRRANAFMSCDDTRYYLHGVALDCEQEVRFVATDGHRLGSVWAGEAMQALTSKGGKYIIPWAAVQLWLKVFRGDARYLAIGASHFEVRGDGVTIKGKLIDGRYPNWRRVIPSPDGRMVACLDRMALLRAVRLMGAMSYRASSRIGILTFSGERAQLVAKSMDFQGGVDIGPTESGVVDLPVNLKYLLQAVEATKGRTVIMQTESWPTTALHEPLVFRGDADVNGDQYIVMPVREAGKPDFSIPAPKTEEV